MANKNQEQHSTRAIIVLSVVVVLLIGVLIASICMQGFTNPDPFGLFAKDEDPSISGGGGMVVDPDDPNANMMKLSVSPKSVASSAEDSKTKVLTATVEPAEAPQEVDWAIAFVNPASEWATGKTVTDYVTITPESDGAKTATVKCLQAFGEQIEVTVSARSDASKNATCTVDYLSSVNIDWSNEMTNSSIPHKCNNYFHYEKGVGTIAPTKITASIDVSPLVKTIFFEGYSTLGNYPVDLSSFDTYKVISIDASSSYGDIMPIPFLSGFYFLSNSDNKCQAYFSTDKSASTIDGNTWWNAMKALYDMVDVGNNSKYLGTDANSINNVYIAAFNSEYKSASMRVTFNFEWGSYKSDKNDFTISIGSNTVTILPYVGPVSNVTVDPGDVIFQ